MASPLLPDNETELRAAYADKEASRRTILNFRQDFTSQAHLKIEDRLIRGDLATLSGLTNAEFNGLQVAIMKGPNKEERFTVLLPSNGAPNKKVAIKKENLTKVVDERKFPDGSIKHRGTCSGMGPLDCGYGHNLHAPPTFAKFVERHSAGVAFESTVFSMDNTPEKKVTMISRATPNLWMEMEPMPMLGCVLKSVTKAYAETGDQDALKALEEEKHLPPLPSLNEVLLLGFPTKFEHLQHQHECLTLNESRLFTARCRAYKEVYGQLIGDPRNREDDPFAFAALTDEDEHGNAKRTIRGPRIVAVP